MKITTIAFVSDDFVHLMATTQRMMGRLAGEKQLVALREEVIVLLDEIRRVAEADYVDVKRNSVEERHA